MPRPPSDKKAKALQMYGQGISTEEIAQRLGVSRRSVQRWIAETDPISKTEITFSVEPVESAKSTESPREQAREVSNLTNEDEVIRELKQSAIALYRSHIRLPGLFNKAIDYLEQVLDDDEASPRHKIEACKILGNWVQTKVSISSRDFARMQTNAQVAISIINCPEDDLLTQPHHNLAKKPRLFTFNPQQDDDEPDTGLSRV